MLANSSSSALDKTTADPKGDTLTSIEPSEAPEGPGDDSQNFTTRDDERLEDAPDVTDPGGSEDLESDPLGPREEDLLPTPEEEDYSSSEELEDYEQWSKDMESNLSI